MTTLDLSRRSPDRPLWTISEVIAATGGACRGRMEAAINGISIDTRTIQPDDLFIAIKGDVQDGHKYAETALEKGAAAVIVADKFEGEHPRYIRVPDTLRAMEDLGRSARARTNARIVAVTGSAGKTTSKEILRAIFEATAPGKVHAADKSFNNHWGVPLTLARMPADTAYGVFEIGMNHPGEIRPLTKMVRPHVAMITTIAPAHLGHFKDIEEIAEAKAEVFEGLDADGVTTGWAVIPADAPHADLLMKRAQIRVSDPGFIFTFGAEGDATMQLRDIDLGPSSTRANLRGPADTLGFELSLAGRHNAMNAAGCIATWFCAVAGQDLPSSSEDQGYAGFQNVCAALKTLQIDPAGRGQVHELANGMTLIDESYNANPASMRAAIDTMALYPSDRRRIAVLGDMLELGNRSTELHAGLTEALKANRIDRVFTCGPDMEHLHNALPPQTRGAHAPTSEELEESLLAEVASGDIIMVKGSLGSRMAPIVAAIRAKHPD